MGRKVYGIKKANVEVQYGMKEIQQLAKCRIDPIYFIDTFVKVQHPTKGIVPFKLFDFQKDMIRMFHSKKKSIVRSARQSGKSQTVAAYLLWFAMFTDNVNVLCVSKDSGAAKEIIDRIQKMYLEVPEHIKCGISDDAWNKHTAAFDNGSKIISLSTTPNSGRGLSISLLFCDELAFVRPNIQEEFWGSIMPTLATGGGCIITSTPNGDTDLYSKLCRGAELGNNDFAYMFIPWNAVPGRDEQFKNERIREVGQRLWDQEYECKFITASGTLFEDYVLQKLEDSIHNKIPVLEIAGEKLWKNINPKMTYLVGCDPATGTGLDYSVIQVVEFPSLEQVMEVTTNILDSASVYAKIKNICNYIASFGATVFFSFENNGVGEGIAALYLTDEGELQAGLIQAASKSDVRKVRVGFFTDLRNKMKFSLRLKKVIENEILKVNSIEFLTECKRYIRTGQTYQAQPGANDDRVMAMLIILRMIEQMSDFDDRAYGIYYTFENVEENDWKTSNTEEDELPLPMIA
jgi:hypothetical protein